MGQEGTTIGTYNTAMDANTTSGTLIASLEYKN